MATPKVGGAEKKYEQFFNFIQLKLVEYFRFVIFYKFLCFLCSKELYFVAILKPV
jgi:hypothetical protein